MGNLKCVSSGVEISRSEKSYSTYDLIVGSNILSKVVAEFRKERQNHNVS